MLLIYFPEGSNIYANVLSHPSVCLTVCLELSSANEVGSLRNRVSVGEG